MARPSNKARHKAQEATKALDRIFAEVDPNLLIAGLLGGTAAAGGIIPPFTRLLTTMGGSAEDLKTAWDVASAMQFGYSGLGGVIPGLFALYTGSQKEDSSASASPATAALFASGALEAMLMFKAFSSPGLLEAVVKAPAEMIKGVGEIVPG